MANKTMVYGANEATTLTDKIANAKIVDSPLKFGVGSGDSVVLAGIAAKEDTDSKLRFVSVGDSGIIFAGNKVVSSKILDITTNRVAAKHFDEATGEYVASSTKKVADKVTVKWFGTAVDESDNTEKTQIWETVFDVVDKDTVTAMIAQAKKDLKDQIDVLNGRVNGLDVSMNAVETFLKATTNITEAENGALTVTPSEGEDFKTYKVGVKVDGSSVKVVNDKLAVATYAIDKIENGEDGYDPGFAAQYRLLMTDPATGTATQVGQTINIMKDFLVKGAHVCSFKYVAENGKEISYEENASQWGTTTSISLGDDVVAGQLPWAKIAGGKWEQAVLNMGIKYGHTYLHLILNTNPTDETVTNENPNGTGNDQHTDVYLDFTEIFESFKGDGQFIEIGPDGVISLKKDAVVAYVDEKILGVDQPKLTEKVAAIDAHLALLDTSVNELKAADVAINEHLTELDSSVVVLKDAVENIEDHLATLDTSVNAIEASYLTDVKVDAPSDDNPQFNKLTITKSANGVKSTASIDVANSGYYTALNNALDTLQANDTYLAGLLTWENLD